MKRILVTGSRSWKNLTIIKEAILTETGPRLGWDLVIHGDARGADIAAELICHNFGIHTAPIAARWDSHGRSAGPIRNRVMLDLKPEIVLAFHEDFENSLGTKDCVEEALRRGIRVRRFDLNGEVV